MNNAIKLTCAALIVCAAGTVAGLGPVAIGASTGDPVVLGVDNFADHTTYVNDSVAGGEGVKAAAQQIGIHGQAFSGDPNSVAVLGDGTGATRGVLGYGTFNGVEGHSSDSVGSGVFGSGDGTGYGVAGIADNGTGVLAQSSSGTALTVRGVARFSRSGVATVAAHNTSVTLTGVALTGGSFVIATLQQARGSVALQAAIPSAANHTLKLVLTAATPAPLKVAWFIVN